MLDLGSKAIVLYSSNEAKTKALISRATAQLIYTFFFRESRISFSHNTAHKIKDQPNNAEPQETV